jgi:hypothetical protein
MSDIGDAQIQVDGQWVDLHEWLQTDATAEEVERIAGRGKGTWVLPLTIEVTGKVIEKDDIDGIAGTIRSNE